MMTHLAAQPPSTGWYYEDTSNQWYYYAPPSPGQSPLKTGWHHDIDGFTYYLDLSDGHMLDGPQTIDGMDYDFLPERNRGNYHQDEEGVWYYRANGLSTYGSLQSGTSPTNQTPSADLTHGYPLVDSSQLVTGRLIIPMKEISNGRSNDRDANTGTGTSTAKPPTSTPSEIPTPPDPSTSPDPSSPPTPPEDDQRHTHTDDPEIRCIATDDWDTILAHKDAYADCIMNHCTTRLYLSGPAFDYPHPSADSTRHDYPLYVSLVDDQNDQLTFAQAYAIPELSDVPIYVGLNQYIVESAAVYKQSNAGGLVDTWLYQILCGTGSGASYIFYMDGGDGTYTHYEYSYPGYQIRKPDTDEEETAGAVLSLQRTQKYISDGYRAENDAANRAFYTSKYLNRPKGKESALVQLRPTKSTLWFPSEQELIAYSIEDARGETGNMPLSIYLKSESQIPELADSWRSSESYWLRSTPSAYLAAEDYDDLGMGTTASTRDEYFLIADSSGIADVAHYDDTAAVRLMFTVK